MPSETVIRECVECGAEFSGVTSPFCSECRLTAPRECKRCHEVKAADDFYLIPRPKSPLGGVRNAMCHPCQKSYAAARHALLYVPAERTCTYCHERQSSLASNRCDECRLTAPKTCIKCDATKAAEEFPLRTEARTGRPSRSPWCKRCHADYASDRHRSTHPPKTCVECRTVGHFLGVSPFCDSCRDLFGGYRATNKARCEKHGVKYERGVNVLRVAHHHGWTCGLCREAIDPELAYPDPRSASLDHVVPLSKGGDHVMGNVQLAHLGCNVDKAASLPDLEEPFTMFTPYAPSSEELDYSDVL